jgi:hypothetical protein
MKEIDERNILKEENKCKRRIKWMRKELEEFWKRKRSKRKEVGRKNKMEISLGCKFCQSINYAPVRQKLINISTCLEPFLVLNPQEANVNSFLCSNCELLCQKVFLIVPKSMEKCRSLLQFIGCRTDLSSKPDFVCH